MFDLMNPFTTNDLSTLRWINQIFYFCYVFLLLDSNNLNQASLKKIEKNIEKNFTDAKGLNLSYYDVDFFGVPLEKTDYLMDDENVTIK